VRMTLVVHIIVGGLGLVSGFVARYSAKGATFAALARGGRESGLAYPLVMFGVVGLSAGAGDLRAMRSRALRGAPRLARHLWRMCFALFIAVLSFFIGQADVFPKPIRIRPLLALPMLAVLVTMRIGSGASAGDGPFGAWSASAHLRPRE
jgi:hypothetical protein